jgi:hypothetical protein
MGEADGLVLDGDGALETQQVTRDRGPSDHLTWHELACWNGTGQLWQGYAPGELVAEYPAEWRRTRAVELAVTFEAIRLALGGRPIYVVSGYRPATYNARVGGARLSQHVQGRAIDLRHSRLPAPAMFAIIRELEHGGQLPYVGGLGSYRTFVHVDVRPRTNGRLALWHGGQSDA